METSKYIAVNQTHQHPLSTTHKYRFVPTTEALKVLADHGWNPVRVQEAGVKKPEYKGYQDHAVWLESPTFTEQLGVGDTVVPRVLLRNSHMGNASFRLIPALLEKVCSNGLMVSQPWHDFRIRHVGYAASKVSAALFTIAQESPHTLEIRHRWKGLSLDVPAQIRFARNAIPLRWDDSSTVEPSALLHFRPEQSDGSLWSVFNTVQESLIRGRVPFRREDGSQGISRAINSIQASVSINCGLWRLAEQAAKAMN